MARMLMPRAPSVWNMVEATPAWLRMPTPTTEILATRVSCTSFSKPMSPRALSSTSRLRGRSAAGTVKVTSVEAALPAVACAMFWTIMSTLIPASASGAKIAPTEPGRSGTATSVIFASFLSCAMPVMSWRSMSSISSSPTISVPRCPSSSRASSNELKTRTRTCSFIASPTERVWSTLAPTLASSSISSYVTLDSLRALGTMRGSVV